MGKSQRNGCNNIIKLYFRWSRAANSVARGWQRRKIKLIQAFIEVLVTCKNEEDPFKNEGARVVTCLCRIFMMLKGS